MEYVIATHVLHYFKGEDNMPSKIKRRGNNTYLLTVAGGYDNKGKQKSYTKTVHVKSDREAEKEYIAFAAAIQRGQIISTNKLKLEDFAWQWFHDYCQKNLAPKTQQTYRNYLEQRIIPLLGNFDLNKLTPRHIIRFINELKDNGKRLDGREGNLSDETIRYCFRVLSSMLKDAVQWQLISSSPCDRVKPPKVTKHQAKVLNEEQVKIMVNCLASEPLKYQTIIIVAITTGMRLGEIVGLKWSDIDFDTNILTVNRTNQIIKNKGIISKSPKNDSSARSLALPNRTIELLKKYKKEQNKQRLLLGELWNDNDWIFTTWNGTAMYPTTPSKWFREFLKRNELPHIPFHGLRHTSATLLIAQGAPLKNISSRLGHSDIRTTGNIYGHALQSVDRKLADTMDNILDEAINKR